MVVPSFSSELGGLAASMSTGGYRSFICLLDNSRHKLLREEIAKVFKALWIVS